MLLDTPIARLRQIAAAVSERLVGLDKRQRAYIEWQTKQLAMVIAATVPTEKGKSNPLLKSVEKMSMSIEPEKKKEIPKEPEVGSYEKIMSGFGRAVQ